MQHHPHSTFGIEAKLDEVVACSERSKVRHIVSTTETRVLLDDRLVARKQRRPRLLRTHRHILPRALVVGPCVVRTAMWHRRFNRGSQCCK